MSKTTTVSQRRKTKKRPCPYRDRGRQWNETRYHLCFAENSRLSALRRAITQAARYRAHPAHPTGNGYVQAAARGCIHKARLSSSQQTEALCAGNDIVTNPFHR